MIPDFFQSTEQLTNFVSWQSIIGFSIVLFATLVSIDIRIDQDDDE